MRRFFYLLVLLCVAQTVCAQRTNDRYPALRYWDFRYSGSADSVDCLFNAKNKELFISGFDTDGKGTFYFAGGCPLRVSCFKGTELQWRREVSDAATTRGLFRLRGDSLYLVQDVRRELIIMSKDGKGDVRHVPLPVDSVSKGYMRPDCIVLWYNVPVVIDGEEHYRIRRDYSIFSYEPRLLWKETVMGEIDETYMLPIPEIYGMDRHYVHYKGVYKNYNVFSIDAYNFAFADMYGTVRKMYKMNTETFGFDVFPMDVLTENVDAETHVSSEAMRFIRGNHYYQVGYDWKNRERLIVAELDLDKAFEQAEDVKL